MAGIAAIALAIAWSGLVADALVESGRNSGAIVVFGRTLVAPGPTPATLILYGFAASAGLAVAAAVAYAHGRRLERRMAEELDERYREITTKAAGDVARAGLLSWRVAELRTSLQDLVARRDELLAEMEYARRRTDELRALSEDYRRSLDELQERLILIPEIEDELAKRRARRAADPSG